MAQWYIRGESGRENDRGPLRPSELLKLVRDGKITPETKLRKDDSAYFAAAEVGGLFEAAMRPTIQYFCPQCRREVHEPPVTCPHCDFNVVRALTKITENTIASPERQAEEATGSSVKRWLSRKRGTQNRDQ